MKPRYIEMKVVRGVDFACHVEDGEIVIDACEGIDPRDGVDLFSPWIQEALEASKKEKE